MCSPGAAPRGGQRLLEVLLKRPGQAGCPGPPLVGALLGPQIPQEEVEVAALHLLRRRAGGHRMLKILHRPPREAVGLARTQGHQRPWIISCSVLGHAAPPFPGCLAAV